MQAVNHFGVYGPVQEFDQKQMESLLTENERVEIFKGTPHEIERRQKMAGKKYKVSRAYQKAPKIK